MEIPSFQDLFTKTGLYEKFDLVDPKNKTYVLDLFTQSIVFDCFCIECMKESTFKISSPGWGRVTFDNIYDSHKTFTITAKCSRNNVHEVVFAFSTHNMNFQKIGQLPSIADIDKVSVIRYKNILEPSLYNELTKSIGLYSHGIGIGSFVYLRRIFESLVNDAYNKSLGKRDDFQTLRMEEKILFLKDYLPKFLVENRKLYSILSLGIHSLTEEECLKHFDSVKIAIELILDEKIVEIEKQKKIQSITNTLNSINNELK